MPKIHSVDNDLEFERCVVTLIKECVRQNDLADTSVPCCYSLGYTRWLQPYALVFGISLNSVATPSGHEAIFLALQVALDRIVRYDEVIAVLNELCATSDLGCIQVSGSTFFHFHTAINDRVPDTNGYGLLRLKAAFHVYGTGG